MKRYIIPIGAFLVVLLVVWSAFGQEQERSQLKAQMPVKSGSSPAGTIGREEQLKAIEVIQEQLGKLKTAIQSIDEEKFRRFGELSEEEKAKVRENMTKAAQTRKQVITKVEEKLEVLRETGQRRAQPLMPLRELQLIREVAVKEKASQTARSITRLITLYHEQLRTIRELAVKEKAKGTASRLERLIARYQAEFKRTQKTVP
jgi:conjugal transfer/entry exclusion protein